MSFVYLLFEEQMEGETLNACTKIGFSKNPPEWRRDANLKRGNPRNLRFGAVYLFNSKIEGLAAETAAHSQFRPHLLQKEWFSVHWRKVDEWCAGQGWRRRRDGGGDAFYDPPPTSPT